MSERFFLPQAPAAGKAVLTGDEARHLVTVLRARVGDEVTLFDGSGRSWSGLVTSLGRLEAELEVGPPREPLASSRPAVTLAVALPKGDRQRWLVEKLTELGVERLVPLRTERGVAEPTSGAIKRLERGVIEACKQCGRDRLMAIGTPATVAEIVAAKPAAAVGIVADPAGEPLAASGWQEAMEVIGLVGPEGGFTPAELAAATAAGWPRVAIGSHVLRIETAAVAMAARLA